MRKKELVSGGMGKKFFDILNTCYSHLYNYSRLDDAQVDDLIKNYISLADLNLITIVVDDNKDGEMIGFGVSFPSFSEALKKTKNGKLLPFGWYHLLKALKFHDTKTVDLLLCGVLPEYRAKGGPHTMVSEVWFREGSRPADDGDKRRCARTMAVPRLKRGYET